MHAELLKVTLYSCKWLAISCNITTQKCNIVQCRVQLTCVHVKITWQCKSTSSERGGSRGRVQEVRTPPPPEMICGFLIQLVFCKKKYVIYWKRRVHPLLKKILDPPLKCDKNSLFWLQKSRNLIGC